MTAEITNQLECPSCRNNLTPRSVAGVSVHVCEGGCGGYWVGKNSLKRLPERLPGAGAELLSVPRSDGVHLFRNVDHICPHCQNTLLYRHWFSRKLQLEVDQCAKCAGFWVEVGELASILTTDLDEAERIQRAEAYFEVVIRDKVGGMNLVNDDMMDAARHIVQIFRFLCPKQYFPDAAVLSNILR
ncbi:conserved hypothetical protein [Nitrospina gracilis 3/211]|uniref:Transcription factor zinc-finger domain-containing protein n=1 Tax=Nitrospina gracilis (strain 3/211) TaxID=1266370 RepID=M1YHT5_NITG3|nr:MULTISPECIES: zf-TFIIB domain-containing protein [Nitrospina]MCF8723029.1 Zn-finger nucleic acid-binding protein [Nitrospina sp. Nb-3]CCQ90060.1 conserved hypothetical protein [Nitrospina gracilis 3/211]